MAYTAPRTWVTGELVTAALLNAHLRDNLNAAFPVGIDAWTAYTPTLTQSGAVTKTVTYAKYQRVGRWITARGILAVTGSGSAGVAVLIGLPVTAAGPAGMLIGGGKIGDASAGLAYKGLAELSSTSVFGLAPTDSTVNNYLGATGFTAALANTDFITFFIDYESAS